MLYADLDIFLPVKYYIVIFDKKEALKLFCDRLKTARVNAKMSQREVAEKIGISQTSYSFLESGLREPSMLYLRRIAALLNVSIDWLCDNHPDEEELVLTGNKK